MGALEMEEVKMPCVVPSITNIRVQCQKRREAHRDFNSGAVMSGLSPFFRLDMADRGRERRWHPPP